MPRTPKPRYTLSMTNAVWEDLISRLETNAWDANAVLAGTTSEDGATVSVTVADTDTDETRAEQRRVVSERDMDVIGQVSMTYDTLDTTIAKTKADQEGRRQTIFSIPEGHVFLHVHNINGRLMTCAAVLRGKTLHQAHLSITEAEGKSVKVRRPRKPRNTQKTEETS